MRNRFALVSLAAALAACGQTAADPEFASACEDYYSAGFETLPTGQGAAAHCSCIVGEMGRMMTELGMPGDFKAEVFTSQTRNYRTGLRKREVMGLAMPGYENDSLAMEAMASPQCE